MFGDIEYALRKNLQDRAYAEEYASSFLNAYIATQIKVIREQRVMTQAQLGQCIGTTQAGISRYENVNYSSWSLRILRRIARAFDVRLRVSFEPYGTLPDEVVRFDRVRLETVDREHDPGIVVYDKGASSAAVDIAAHKALSQVGQSGGETYGSDNNPQGQSARDDRTGRLGEQRESQASGLYSAHG